MVNSSGAEKIKGESQQSDRGGTGSSKQQKLNPAGMLSQYKNASLEFGSTSRSKSDNGVATGSDESLGAYRLAKQLELFTTKGLETALADDSSGAPATSQLGGASIADLQLQTARKLRQLLPAKRELLHLVQQKNWIPLLLGWLNLHDRPAVQMEALLALTNIAELCAQQSYYSSGTSSAPSKKTGAAAGGAFFPPGESGSSPVGYPSLVPPQSGSVPFPPLSFSQTMSDEALAAFDASLLSTVQQSKARSGKQVVDSVGTSTSGKSSNSYLPPPTPVSKDTNASLFPQHLSASSQHLLLRHADAIPTLISLLANSNREVYEQAMWVLGNVAAGESSGTSTGSSSGSNSDTNRDKAVAARDVILAAGVMKPLLRCLDLHPNNLSLQRIGCWTLSNLVEGIFQQPNHGKGGSKSTEYSSSDSIDMQILLPVLKRLLLLADSECLSYSCWTLSHLCDGPSSHISAVVTTKDPKAPRGGLVPRLVELLGHSSWRVTKPALRTIGNIVCAECSDDNNHNSATPTDYTEIILDCRAVPKLKELVTHSNREIQKEACWTLSNIAAGTVDQIQAVIDSGAIPPLVKLVSGNSTDQEVRSEACWVVLNATSCGSDAQIEVLVDEGCVSVLGVLLGEASMVMMALEGLERVLQVEEAREAAKRELGEEDDDEVLVSASLIEKALDKHNSTAVTKRANRIWKQHFVSCALCHKSFSKHRTADATFCEECKCYVCCNCDCQIYHLSYQEELWAATEEQSEAKKNAKKSKRAKKKEKMKQKKEKMKQDQQPHVQFAEGRPSGSQQLGKEGSTVQSRSSTVNSSDDSVGDNNFLSGKARDLQTVPTAVDEEARNSDSQDDPTSSDAEDEEGEATEGNEEERQQQPPIDFVLYLQQTGSIIALAKLMDALEYGEGYEGGDNFDDTDLKMLRQQTLLSEPPSN